MKVLFIGGTGQISSAIVRKLSKKKDYEVWLLNRGSKTGLGGFADYADTCTEYGVSAESRRSR